MIEKDLPTVKTASLAIKHHTPPVAQLLPKPEFTPEGFLFRERTTIITDPENPRWKQNS